MQLQNLRKTVNENPKGEKTMSNSTASCTVRTLFAVLFIASVALNAAFMTGCSYVRQLLPCQEGKSVAVTSAKNDRQVYDATDDLRKIAEKLGVRAQEDSAASIASAIQTRLYVDANAKGMPSETLTNDEMENISHRLPEKQAEKVAEYHKFIKSLEGKRFIIVP